MDPGDNHAVVIKRVKVEAFEGRPTLQYRIQLVNESLVDEAVTFMKKYYASNNNLRNSLGHISGQKECTDPKDSYWKMIFSQGISLAAIVEDDQGNKDTMICCYALEITKREDTFDMETIQDMKSRYACKTMMDVMKKVDLFELYNCDAYVDGCGLATATDYQRRGVAGEVMGACAEVCKLAETPVCSAVFTAEASQKLAHRHGYKTLAELDLTTFRIDGKIVYPKPEWPVIKVMAIRYF